MNDAATRALRSLLCTRAGIAGPDALVASLDGAISEIAASDGTEILIETLLDLASACAQRGELREIEIRRAFDAICGDSDAAQAQPVLLLCAELVACLDGRDEQPNDLRRVRRLPLVIAYVPRSSGPNPDQRTDDLDLELTAQLHTYDLGAGDIEWVWDAVQDLLERVRLLAHLC